jgi:uncharacterized protein
MDKIRDIFMSIKYGDPSEYFSIIDLYEINVRNKNGDSLLHCAITAKKFDIANDLINRGIDVNIVNTDGQSVGHYLSFYPNLQISEKLLKLGMNINFQDKWGNTPLWYAIYNGKGNYELVRLFIEYGADPEIINKAGKSSLDFAKSKNNDQLILMLKKID